MNNYTLSIAELFPVQAVSFKRNLMKARLLLLLFVLVGVACTNQQSNMENAEFNNLLEEYHHRDLEMNPLWATVFGIEGYDHLFPDFLSEEYIEEQKEYYAFFMELAKDFSDDKLSEEQQRSREILVYQCETKLEAMAFPVWYFPVDQTWSKNLIVSQMAGGQGAQPFETVEDYNNWLKRLEGFVSWMHSAERRMREGMTKGYVLPRSLVEKTLPTLEPFTKDDPEEHLYYAPVRDFPEDFSEEKKQRLTEAFSEIIGGKIVPGFRSLHAFMAGEYLEASRESSGYGDLPGGARWYAHRVRSETSTGMNPEEVFKLGKKEVARILGEMEKVKMEVGFEGSLQDFFAYVRNLDKLRPYDDPQQVIDGFNAIHATMKPNLEKLFDLTPTIPFEVRRVEAFREKTTGPRYNPGTPDGSRPAIFYVSVPDVENYNVFTDETLFLHEAIPGHHYQMALTQENTALPEFRKMLWFNAYGEGWALYAESLGKELGLFTDPYQYLGNLNDEMHRAIRLVVDPGLHAFGWSREEAIAYMLENEPVSEQFAISEVERYMANPGQALGYKVGQLKILELRARAEAELGAAFDIRAFHNELLRYGGLPLSLLEELVEEWIDQYKQKA